MAELITQFEGYRYNAGTATSPGSHEVYFMLSGLSDNDPETAIAQARALMPPSLFGSTLKNWSIAEYKNNEACQIRATYQNKETSTDSPEELEGETITFDTSGGTEHITQSIKTLWVSDDEKWPDDGGVLGYDGERVNGIDVPKRSFKFSVRKQYYTKDFGWDERIRIWKLSATINEAKIGPFGRGELLFSHAAESQSSGVTTVTYNFEANVTRSNYKLGDDFTVSTEKEGWTYEEARYEDDLDNGETMLIKRIRAVRHSQVLEYADLKKLELDSI